MCGRLLVNKVARIQVDKASGSKVVLGLFIPLSPCQLNSLISLLAKGLVPLSACPLVY